MAIVRLTLKKRNPVKKENVSQKSRIEMCEKLVRHQARIAKNEYLGYIDLEELVQEGMVAVCEADKRFDPSKGVMFTTFAFPYIQRHFIDMHSNSRRGKRSVSVQQAEDAKVMETTHPIFPTKHNFGTTYRLDLLYEDAERRDDDEHPVLGDPKLQVQSCEQAVELRDALSKTYKKLRSPAREILQLFINPPDIFLDFLKEKADDKFDEGKISRDSYKLYAEFLGISMHTFNIYLREVRRTYERLTEETYGLYPA
jgi:RNA polymerase sigma factor (sigma-70 family)